MDDATERSERIADLLDRLTLEEKVSLTHGAVDPAGNATGYVPGVDRLGIPELRLADGPLGVRTEDPATAFPASISLAATFDPDLAREQGRAMAREALARDQDVLLAPGLNLIRVPHNGRNFEYYSEDPVVSGRFAAGVVSGIHDEDVIATPKHFVANNQESHRAEVSAEVDERVLRELYLPAFRDAVAAGAGALMTAYNRINGTYASEHERLLREVLKGEWDFDGVVMSDWFGTQFTADTANGGLDLQMPGVRPDEQLESDGTADAEDDGDDSADTSDGVAERFADGLPDPERGDYFSDALQSAVESGEVPEERLDDMVARLLGQAERVGLFDGDRGEGAVDTPDHRDLAERIAVNGTVLLENDGVLPLADDADVALIGPNVDEAITGGGGSSETEPVVSTSPVEGVEARAEGAVTVERGHERIVPVTLLDAIHGDQGDDEADDEDVDRDAAVAAAADADVAVVFVRDTATEAADRGDLRLAGEQDDLVEAVAAANDRTVVVVGSSGPVELPWREDVAAVLQTWYPGQAHGDAAAAVLYGDADPGGRLPVTFAPEPDYPTAGDERRYPGVDYEAHYDEGLLVGYRHFDAAGVDPTYPFGHGDSYAEFRYGDAEVTGDRTVHVDVENASDRDGREVVQAYVAAPEAPDDLERPPRELAGFAAVEVPAGESRTVELTLDERALGRYDADEGWTVDDGEFTVHVGRSSRDLRDSVTIER
ncbi:beta-glucosidase family protein [Halomicrobium salinisoli]|uniref:beta-glucosidase family protein n=1 Tax=Halomicrobium salinisoli TaxID=2878391 RepID=UPI001CF0A373|nr:glycoside hydrolase family 3 C-terminal domain-containing protein [Halomicrobium salinisoli]